MPNINNEHLPESFYFRVKNSSVIYKAVYEAEIDMYKTVAKGEEEIRSILSPTEVENCLKNGIWLFEETFKTDPVNKPSHYHKNEIDVNGYLEKHFPLEGSYTVAEGFYIGNVIKYTSRYKDKNGLQDLEKAKFNLNKLIELEESK
jgi:hypothetical protein